MLTTVEIGKLAPELGSVEVTDNIVTPMVREGRRRGVDFAVGSEEMVASAKLAPVRHYGRMNLSPDTRRIMETVERLTGKPVQLIAKPDLPTLAKVTAAHESIPVHIIVYKPNAPGVDYHIAYQCGFVIRLHENPPNARFGFGDTQEGRADVRQLLSGPNGTLERHNLPEAALCEVTDQVYGGLLTQLRSVPIGMRIDAWLWDDYPRLRAAQSESMAVQQSTNALALGPNIRDMMPTTLFSANAAMNAAYALFADRLLSTQLYSIPYRSVGLLDRGHSLLDLWERTPADAAHDRDLVDAWGNDLGLSDWYQWVPMT